jgi:hypothetical protein
MKAPLPFLLAAGLVFTGAAFFHARRAEEAAASSRSPGSQNGHSRVTGLTASASMAATAPAASGISAPPFRPAPAKGALIDRVEQNLQASTKPEMLAELVGWTDDLTAATMKRVAGLSDAELTKVKARLAATRRERQRNALRLDLTPAQRIAAQAALTQVDDAWLKELLGTGRFEKYEASRKARQLADAESAASRGLSRISRAVPLRPDQKDALYAGFVTAAMSPAAEAIDPITRFRVTSSISEEPPVPAIQEEAKTILTPEQWAQYEEQTKLSSEGQNRMTEHLMSMLPVLLSSLQQLLEESVASPTKPR